MTATKTGNGIMDDLTDIPQVERASFHLVAILGSDQPFFDQLYCGSGI